MKVKKLDSKNDTILGMMNDLTSFDYRKSAKFVLDTGW